MNVERKNKLAIVKAINPIRSSMEIPVHDSIKGVTVEVPKIAPAHDAIESQYIILL
jgi:hypothetical protein